MRAERMISTLLLLQSRGLVTARELATELETSVSTARRDLESLARAGVPIYPQPGRGGGWTLVGGARTDLSGLTAGESQALFSLLGTAEGSQEGAATAVRKLLRALPGPFRPDAEAAAAAVHRDGGDWGELAVERPPSVETVQRAVISRVRIRLDHTRRDGERTSATLSPLGLVAKRNHWYLIALRDGAEGVRTYRMDRVGSVEVTDEPADRPADFDLAREWQRIAARIESRRSGMRATVRVPRRHLWVLRDHFGSYLEEVTDLDEHWTEITVAAHTARGVAEQLAGWGATVHVIGPESVRRELARIGAELVDAYPSQPVDPSDQPG